MNHDEIIRIAKEAGYVELANDSAMYPPDFFERFAALVAEPLQARIKDLYRQLDEAEKQLDRQYAMGIEAERDRCILILERLYERSGEQYKQYLHAAKVLKGEI